MYSRPQLLRKYLHYLITSSNGKGHGIHSPFVFDFIEKVLNDKNVFPAYEQMENLRRQLLKDKTILEVADFGAGSAITKKRHRSIKEIARYAAKPKKYGQLLYRIAHYYQPQTILELGTSLGLSTAYLSLANPSAEIFTFEGASSVASVAENNFRLLGLTNIELVKGNFDETLPGILEKTADAGLAFIDGNHRKEPTLQYFNLLLPKTGGSSIFIFDDIHWSPGMENAWEEIKQHPSVLCTIDLFFAGVVFFRNEFKIKQHFTIRF